MAITFPRAFLTHRGPSEITIRQSNVVGMNVSPFSLVPQVYEWPGAERWEADIGFDPMDRATAEPWVAFFTSMRGPVGSFTMGDPAGASPRGTVSGSVTATGSVRSHTITLSGGTGTLLAGDWISFGSSRWLHKVMVDVTLGSTPSCEIWPSLRAALSSSALTYSGAKGRFMLTETPQWTIGPASVYERLTIKAIEDLRP
ncbi:hypothetical protein [Reyranella sp.]|jgi:hypothetical protein|uniref:hypothetical protein n=1 Tax=Reyranella sp. TaxID=1929291 RepID=UPI000BD095BC|nr:hypothetical protein [Reyranella sp.]OYY35540.1 MAG: hypothetical protein B7Y57_25500 [Rhodospirillales bacterium 35-66-84]OYZ91410.1 MAG: hypothetical protein B7Y08_25370 [Rhodospirillales bacterium 24-66-33]OZB26240.1 MAG: hypothetical protein B7X63_09880 [Rhodospirillales bacterium 39-66-50]HQS15041.1 hypothetical protein [Reyranella sp.]HQT10850.1 hypothetical protein [Reyranella sp.]